MAKQAPRKRHILFLAILASTALMAAPLPAAKADGSDASAKIVGGILGSIIGSAADPDKNDFEYQYYRKDQDENKFRNDNADNSFIDPNRFSATDSLNNRPFNPASDVVCYPAQQICFHKNGNTAPEWTLRLYKK